MITPHQSLRAAALGPLEIAFFVISAAGPLVAMAGGIPVAMLFGNGAGTPALFLAATLLLLVFSKSYTAMARVVSDTGAFFAFARVGLGSRVAAATGFIALLSYNAMQLGLYGLFGYASKGLVEMAGSTAPPWYVFASVAWASIAWFGYRQIDLSAKVLGLLVACEYLVVLVLDVSIAGSSKPSGDLFAPFSPGTLMQGAPAIGLILCFSAFVGFEATTIYSEEAKDPDRSIPLATYLSVGLIGAFYLVSTWMMVVGAGTRNFSEELKALKDPTELVFTLADKFVSRELSTAMRLLFVTSCYASLLAFHNAIARYLFAIGREGLLPARLATVHPRFSSPHVGSFVQSMIAVVAIALAAVGGADPILVVFALPSAVATLGIITLMAISAAATWRYFARNVVGNAGVQVASALSLLCFVLAAGASVAHFDVLTGTKGTVNLFLPALIPLVALLGVVMTILQPASAEAGQRRSGG